jgi:hypothetical protein
MQKQSVLVFDTPKPQTFHRGFNAPMLQSFLNYALLAIVFGSIVIAEQRQTLRHHLSHFRRDEALRFARGKGAIIAATFAAFALSDVQANFLIVLAYQYTSMLSITVLDCFTIPTVTILSILFLGKQAYMNEFCPPCLRREMMSCSNDVADTHAKK